MRLAHRSALVFSAAITIALAAVIPARHAFSHGVDAPKPAPEFPVLTPAQTMASYKLPPGYRLELVAAEPLVQDPVAIDFDPDGRMYVVEMRAFMPNLEGKGEDRPSGRIVVLEDTNDDGKMDKKTVFMDSLVLPRSVKVLEHGVLIAETPNLWFARDTNGDFKADTKTLVRNDYGTKTSNPEHNANGLVWGMDNWIHNANYAGELRVRNGAFDYRKTQSLGQWGLSMDSHGRFYRNSNEDPLHVDLVPERYGARGANQATLRGPYERLVPNIDVWPAHKTPAVNRGYQPGVLRADGRLAKYTSASSPTAYTGDRLPAELRDNLFVTEPAGNLVGHIIVQDDSTGTPVARNGSERPSFLASTDTRSRPVALTTAPDGTMYVVDMYRGIIQHRVFVTGYLEEEIKRLRLEQPVGLGRIYRLVHKTTKRGPKPHLSTATPAQLVETLKHPNGWWRMTAQRLLVERNETSVAPALRQLFRSATSDVTRLHALWTLDGLDSVDEVTLLAALGDRSQHVRAAAIQIAEPRLKQSEGATTAAVMRLVNDPTPAVRRQLAASLGELPASERESALAAVTATSGDDPIVADMVLAGLEGRERAFLERTLTATVGAQGAPVATVKALSGGVLRARDTSGVRMIVEWASDDARPRWQRVALLEGLSPSGGGGRGGRGGAAAIVDGSEGAPPPARGGGGFGGGGGRGAGVTLAAPPAALLAMAESSDSVLAGDARRVSGMLNWPGKPRPVNPGARALTAEEEKLFAAGKLQFEGTCAGCHQLNGEGRTGIAKSLVGSRWALSPAAQVIRIVLHGKEGEMLMPPIGASLTDLQIASVLTYVRRSWGNQGLPISQAEVAEARGSSKGRKRAWTEAELATIRR
ncbi:hypothetical protein BH09GEM1_BH09GEM1_05520 [soil metagenome]